MSNFIGQSLDTERIPLTKRRKLTKLRCLLLWIDHSLHIIEKMVSIIGCLVLNIGRSALTIGHSALNIGRSVLTIGHSGPNIGRSALTTGRSVLTIERSALNKGRLGLNIERSV